jgi:hypothetical protein
MPRKDQIHGAVRNALIKAGWHITDDPYRIHYEDVDVYADLRIERVDPNALGHRALVIEIKSFVDESAIHGLEVALGQYEAYRTLLRAIDPELKLYLAIDDPTYQSEFQRKSFQLIVREHHIALLIVDIVHEEIVTWLD